jgi:hypothetical protein
MTPPPRRKKTAAHNRGRANRHATRIHIGASNGFERLVQILARLAANDNVSPVSPNNGNADDESNR